MDLSEPVLTAEDHAYRHAADVYFEEKGKAARSAFDSKLLPVFLSFEEHWGDFFVPRSPEQLREYLATPYEVRKGQFERFKRECRAWEVSFRHCSNRQSGAGRTASASGNGGNGNGHAGANGNGNGTGSTGSTDWSDLKRRLDAQKSKVEQVRAFYDNLDNLLDQARQRRSHPIELYAHLRVLGVPYDATLDDVKKQYKRMARVHHPDRNGDPMKMSRLSEAYRAILAFYKVALSSSS